VLRTEYLIDDLQPLYFTITSYNELFALLDDLPAMLETARDAAPIPPGTILPTDQRS